MSASVSGAPKNDSLVDLVESGALEQTRNVEAAVAVDVKYAADERRACVAAADYKKPCRGVEERGHERRDYCPCLAVRGDRITESGRPNVRRDQKRGHRSPPWRLRYLAAERGGSPFLPKRSCRRLAAGREESSHGAASRRVDMSRLFRRRAHLESDFLARSP